jgi:hypothetical protein
MNAAQSVSASAAAGPTTVLLFVVLWVLLYVWIALALSALFRKCGEESWKGWVPVYNQIVVLQLGAISGWFYLLILIPVVGPVAVYVLLIVAAHRINLSFGYGTGMTVLAALLYPVWATVLGFGSARWVGPALHTGPVDATGPAPMPIVGRTRSEHPSADLVVEPWGLTPPAARATRNVPAEEADDAAAPIPSDGPIAFVPGPRVAASDIVQPPAAAPEIMQPRAAARRAPAEPAEPPLVTRAPLSPPETVPEPEPWAPRRSETPPDGGYEETTGEVSAVVGAPQAGAPRSALGAVSAQYTRPEVPEDEVFDETVITRRRRLPWELVPPIGVPIDILSDVVILGRRPAADPEYPKAQLIALADDTRTVSKTHARLELRGDSWFVTDLGSTNGVLLVTLMGTEIDAAPGIELAAGERFFLGDAEVRLRRTDT